MSISQLFFQLYLSRLHNSAITFSLLYLSQLLISKWIFQLYLSWLHLQWHFSYCIFPNCSFPDDFLNSISLDCTCNDNSHTVSFPTAHLLMNSTLSLLIVRFQWHISYCFFPKCPFTDELNFIFLDYKILLTYFLLYLSQLLISWWIFQLYLSWLHLQWHFSYCIFLDCPYPIKSFYCISQTTYFWMTYFLLHLSQLPISWWIFKIYLPWLDNSAMTFFQSYLWRVPSSWWFFQLNLSNCISSDDFFTTVSSSSAYLSTLPFMTTPAIAFFLLYLLYLLISWWFF